MAEAWEVQVQRLDGRVDAVEVMIANHKDDDMDKWRKSDETHKELFQRVDRPSWAVTVVLSLLSSGFVGLAVFALTK